MAQFVEVEHRGFEATLARCAEFGGVDLIFTSPPYPTVDPSGKGREGAPPRLYGGDTLRNFSWEDYQRLGDLCFNALIEGGFCIIVVDGPIRFWRSKKIGSERSLIAFKLAVDWAERVGFRYVEHEVYNRLGPPGDYHPRRRSGFEPMHVFQKPGAKGFFDAWAITSPAKKSGERFKNGVGTKWCGRVYRGVKSNHAFVQLPTKTLHTCIPAGEAGPTINASMFDREHPAPFSSYLAKAQIVTYCQPSGIVCDPFNGSGTTGIAAAKHGRSFIGGDLGARKHDDRRWADIGRERAEAAMAEFAASVGVAPAGAVDRPAPIVSTGGQMKLL